MDKHIDTLKEEVERHIGKKPNVHGDFTKLSEVLYHKHKELISPTTLKRLWGYFKHESPAPQTRTLNTLSAFVGYKDYQDFCDYQDAQNSYSSEFVKHGSQQCYLMKDGEKIKISWYPQRVLILRHEGDGDLFTVVSSQNSKLEPGMKLHCETFTMNEMLLLRNVKGGTLTESCDYICGKIGGIEFEMLKQNETK